MTILKWERKWQGQYIKIWQVEGRQVEGKGHQGWNKGRMKIYRVDNEIGRGAKKRFDTSHQAWYYDKTRPVFHWVKERKGWSDDAARIQLPARGWCGDIGFECCSQLWPWLGVGPNRCADTCWHGIACWDGMYSLSPTPLWTPYEGHATEPFCWLTLWRDQLGSSCASSLLLHSFVYFDDLSPVGLFDVGLVEGW